MTRRNDCQRNTDERPEANKPEERERTGAERRRARKDGMLIVEWNDPRKQS